MKQGWFFLAFLVAFLATSIGSIADTPFVPDAKNQYTYDVGWNCSIENGIQTNEILEFCFSPVDKTLNFTLVCSSDNIYIFSSGFNDDKTEYKFISYNCILSRF